MRIVIDVDVGVGDEGLHGLPGDDVWAPGPFPDWLGLIGARDELLGTAQPGAAPTMRFRQHEPAAT